MKETGKSPFFTSISLTWKMLVTTLLCGALVWGVMDHVQQQRLGRILYEQQDKRLQSEAQTARRYFDDYIMAFSRAAKFFLSFKQFGDYLQQTSWNSPSASIKIHDSIPPWLPDASVIRTFTHVHYALLLDENGATREIYQATSEPPPQPLLQQDILLPLLSNSGSSYMTSLVDEPYILTAETYTDEISGRKATLMLASPLNDDFLKFSQGFAASDHIIALISGNPLQVIASSKPDILPDGSRLANLEGRFMVMGKSFFDYGSSDISLQFTSLISNEEYASTGRSILMAERRMLTISALIFVLVMTAAMLWLTRQLHGLTVLIMDFSRKVLHVDIAVRVGGDELFLLKKYFYRLTSEVDASQKALIAETVRLEEAQEELKTINDEIVGHREMLQEALDEITRLIEAVARRSAFDVRFSNPNLVKCYELLECSQQKCPCYGQPLVRCWQISGTYCKESPTGKFATLGEDCTRCKVYRQATKDPIYMIGECFNNMMNILEQQHLKLNEAYKDLKATQSQMLQHEKMASIGQIAAGVAHEINNPTGFIISNLGTLKKYLERLNEFNRFSEEALASLESKEIEQTIQEKKKQLKIDYIREDLDNLVRETLEGAERVKAIVQNLKTFSRLDEAQSKMDDINAGIESTLNILVSEVKDKAVVKKDLGEIPLTLCNLGHLNQVFMNIIINAAQSIDGQGEISIKSRADNGFIVVTFSDTGRGIPPESLARIFEPFFTTKDVGQGTGLGLSIAYDIVHDHHGEITAASEVGKGTTFTVRIPINQIDKSSLPADASDV